MNHCMFTGRVTKDIVLKYTTSQKAFAMFTIAVRRNGNKDETDFINCTAWDKTAENLNKYCHKGSMILVDGRLQVEPYEKDGHKRTDIKVVAQNIEFLDKKEEPKQEKKFVPTNEPDPFFDEGEQDSFGDLPF